MKKHFAIDQSIAAPIADALVTNYTGVFELFCGKCFRRAVQPRKRNDANHRLHPAAMFVRNGWRFSGRPICPECDKGRKTHVGLVYGR